MSVFCPAFFVTEETKGLEEVGAFPGGRSLPVKRGDSAWFAQLSSTERHTLKRNVKPVPRVLKADSWMKIQGS